VALALWRDIALVWLALLCFIGLLVPLAVSLFAVKGMHAAVDRTPRLLRQVQGYSRAMRTQTGAASLRIAEPVIQAHKRSTRLATALDRLLRRPASQQRGETRR
jgi:hypothetical protein